MTTRTAYVLRWLCVVVSFIVFGYGIDVMVFANLGVSPWEVFHLGIAWRFGYSLGTVTFVVGAVIVASGWLLGVKPYWATLANLILVSSSIDFFQRHDLVWTAESLPGRVGLFFLGMYICSIMTAVYTSARLGAGPRDGLMLAMTAKGRFSVAWVRNAMEITVTIVGWLIGGPVGVGTVLVALLYGPFVQSGYQLIDRFARGNVALVLQTPVQVKRVTPLPEEGVA